MTTTQNDRNSNNAPFIYYIEKMKNIKSIHLVIKPCDGKSFYYFNVKSTHHSYQIDIKNIQDTTQQYTIDIKLPLHCKIDPRSTIHNLESNNILSNNNSIEIKSSLLIDDTNFDQHLYQDDVLQDHHSIALDRIDSLKSSLFDNSSHSSNIYCKYCFNTFINEQQQQQEEWKVKLLPSSNWVDLMDIWLCGCTGTTSFTDFPTSDITSIKQTCFVGDRYLLFHSDDIDKDHVYSSNSSHSSKIIDKDQQWDIVQCKLCHSSIGLSNDKQDYKLFKHQLTTSTNISLTDINTSNLFRQYTLETYISTYILSEHRSSIIYKFLIVSITDNTVYSMISLLNWETLLLSNFNNIDNDINFKPIIKVLYKNTFLNSGGTDAQDQEKERQQNQEILKTWSQSHDIKRIYLLPQDCIAVLSILANSNTIYPHHRKHFKNNNNFNMGYLSLR
ncbi:hypothetical protein CYY_002852 [Polysphondylium violaceum]|uniref:HECT-type E3 ubiquitin transferase E3D n=1 Tax=Polysphondylium violaceum TaxID=133409 RepID=A0A8J4Q7H6_9MYCE|nr:hypothetical protein CYY_002852 [Polysphondylium violaceum]